MSTVLNITIITYFQSETFIIRFAIWFSILNRIVKILLLSKM